MVELIHAAIAIKKDREARYAAACAERDWLMRFLAMDDNALRWWMDKVESESPGASKLTEERLDAMREAARDKAAELLDMKELERLCLRSGEKNDASK